MPTFIANKRLSIYEKKLHTNVMSLFLFYFSKKCDEFSKYLFDKYVAKMDKLANMYSFKSWSTIIEPLYNQITTNHN